MIALKIMYSANILVAGWISINCLFFPNQAVSSVFTNSISYSGAIQLVGALWMGIFILSMLGIFFPQQMSLVFVFQLIYKSIWLLAVAIPSLINQTPFPRSMAIFFLIWVLVLPFIIPWKSLFN